MFHTVFHKLNNIKIKSANQDKYDSLQIQCLSLAMQSDESLKLWLEAAVRDEVRWIPRNVNNMFFTNIWFEVAMPVLEHRFENNYFMNMMYVIWLNHLIDTDQLFSVCRTAFIAEQWKRDPEFVLEHYDMDDIKTNIKEFPHASLPVMQKIPVLYNLLKNHISPINIQNWLSSWEQNTVFVSNDALWLKALIKQSFRLKDLTLEHGPLTPLLIGACFSRNKREILEEYKEKFIATGQGESDWFDHIIEILTNSLKGKERFKCLVQHKNLFDGAHQFIIKNIHDLEMNHTQRWDVLSASYRPSNPTECEVFM